MPTLVRVNGEEIHTATALREGGLHNSTFLEETIRNVLIREYAGKQGISNSDQELQLAADELRYNRGLEKVDAVHQWMRENHQTIESVQDGVNTMLLNNKVRSAIPEDQVQAWYAEHQLELETVELYSIRVDSESKASELLSQINDEGANFHLLAMEHSLDEDSRKQAGYVGELTRSQMTSSVEAAVFRANPPAIIGPVKTEKGWNLFKAGPIHKPSLDDAKSSIRVRLMEELTARLLSEATIEYPIFEDSKGEA